MFDKLKKFEDYQTYICKYLNGEYENTPWHYGEIDTETINLLYDLKNLNKLGFITINSQPGTYIKTDKYMELQRGYIEGFMKKNLFNKLLKNIKSIKNNFVIYYYNFNKKQIDSYPKIFKNNDYYLYDNVINLTKDKDINNLEWRYYSTLKIDNIDIICNDNLTLLGNESCKKDFIKKSIYVFIVMIEQNKLGLEKEIYNLLNIK